MLHLATRLLAFATMATAIGLAAAQDAAEYESIPAPETLAPSEPGTLPNTVVVDPQSMDGGYDAFAPIGAPPGVDMQQGSPWSFSNPFAGFEGGEDPYCPPSAYPGYEPPWSWQFVPDGLIYRSYLAGPRESRMAAVWDYDTKRGRWVIDGALGGRVGLLRFGNEDPLRPKGFQLDAEGAAFPRIDLQSQSWDLETADFRWGLPLTYGRGPWEYKLAYYHLSSHLGDEYMVSHPNVQRINFVRDAFVFGAAYRYREALRIYGEVGYLFHSDGGAKPWEFQFGAEYSQRAPTGLRGSPFFAINAWLRQENNFGGTLAAQAGWQWRGYGSGHLLRLGGQYFVGQSVAFEFYKSYEQMLGIGLWYDY